MGEAAPVRGTSTSAFGSGKRENHDASAFYARFEAPEVSTDDTVNHQDPEGGEPLICGDARKMVEIADNSVALVVTSPPYFAGKEYEAALGDGHIPGSYMEFLELLRDVFADCKRVLEPGGRIAVNVANLGRKPYRSLSGDVARILQDDLKLLLRGEVVWVKARGASGSSAWGSFRNPANPVLRDVTERVVIASKGRFDRAKGARERERLGLPHRFDALTTDEFLEATIDVWEIPSESASRVGHPAPFPVELPQRLISLYTYEDDLVLDPFLGSGSTAVAALRTNRRYAGYDTDEDYVRIARKRVAAALRDRAPDAALCLAAAEKKTAPAIAEAVLARCGFTVAGKNRRLAKLGLAVGIVAEDAAGRTWHFDVTGSYSTTRGGLAKSEVAWKALGRAAVLRSTGVPLVLLTTELPSAGSESDLALRAAGPGTFFDAVEILADGGRPERLAAYATGGSSRPLTGFWSAAELGEAHG